MEDIKAYASWNYSHQNKPARFGVHLGLVRLAQQCLLNFPIDLFLQNDIKPILPWYCFVCFISRNKAIVRNSLKICKSR